MRKLICDACEFEVQNLVFVEFSDGEHPHNGSAMSKGVELCIHCLERLNDVSAPNQLRTFIEWDDFKSNKF